MPAYEHKITCFKFIHQNTIYGVENIFLPLYIVFLQNHGLYLKGAFKMIYTQSSTKPKYDLGRFYLQEYP